MYALPQNPSKPTVAPQNLQEMLFRAHNAEVIALCHGVQSTGVSFDVTPPKGKASFTPSKLMLMKNERKMNMLSPEGGKSLFHTDIETGK